MSRTRLFFRRWQNWLGFLLVLFYILVAIAAPYLSPDDPKNPGPFMRVGRAFEGRPVPPNETAILGMLPRGIDVFHALVWGSRDALQFGLIVTITTALFGVAYGAISGYAEGRVGVFMIRVSDAFLAFPPIAGVVFLQQLFLATVSSMGGFFYSGVINSDSNAPLATSLIQSLLEHVNPLMLSLIVFSWMPYARLVHSIVITLKQTDFVQAARALGASPFWIIRKHLIRNSTGPAMVLAARDVGGVVLLQATLTFINIGGDSIWGAMLAQGRNWILGPGGSLLTYWWVFLPPTLAVMLFGISWNLLGDSLNDVLVPTSHSDFYGQSFWDRKKRNEDKRSVTYEWSSFIKRKQKKTVIHAPVQRQLNVAGTPLLPHLAAVPSARIPADRPLELDPLLQAARDSLAHQDLEQALHAYSHLSKHGRHTQEVIHDLAQAARQFPRYASVWQILGDALTRAGNHEYAVKAYEQFRLLTQ
jgi:peptide/nickel transport system permease protein